MESCAKHEDCGGVTKVDVGRFECRSNVFISDSATISWKKPANMKHKKYTEDDINPRELINYLYIQINP